MRVEYSKRPLSLCVLNIRSLRNKSAIFQDYVHECNADLIAVTETWLKEIDDAVRAEVKPTGYKLADVTRLIVEAVALPFFIVNLLTYLNIMLKLRLPLSSLNGK